jgi:drug/metabolite transporter (DMT)-like permease
VITPRAPALPLVAVAVTLVLWSSAFVAIRHLGHSFSPGALSLGRLLVGCLALGVVLLTRGWRTPAPRDWLGLVVIGVLWFGVYNVALNAGEHRVDAGTAAMLIQLSPVLVAVLAAVFLKEKATPMLGVGLLVAFAGVVLIATSTSDGGRRDPVGVLLCLVSAAAYAVSLIFQKPLVSRLSAIEVTWVACTIGALACLPFAGSLLRDTAAASTGDIAWVVYLGVFPTAIAFSTYAFALSSMTAGNLSVTTYLVPPITVLLSWAFLSEAPPAMAYVGGVLCLLGVGLARRRPKAPVAASASPSAST